MTGILTTKRYKYATVYVDQVSYLSFTYLQKTANNDKILKEKVAFEKYASNQGINIRAYHTHNGIFCANKWVINCQKKGQQQTFSGMNAHHQNGLAERRIHDPQELVRTMIIHVAKRWPHFVSANIFLYEIHMENDVLN